MSLPETNPFLIEMKAGEKRGPSALQTGLEFAGGAIRGAGGQIKSMIQSIPGQIEDFYRQASQSPYLPGEPAAATAARGEGYQDAGRTMGQYTPLPLLGKLGPVFPLALAQGANQMMQAGAPVETPQGPVPATPGQVGQRVGGAAVGLGMGAPGIPGGIAGAALRRFRPAPAPTPAGALAAPGAPGAPSGEYDVSFGPNGPIYTPRSVGGTPTRTPRPAASADQGRLNAGPAGLTASKVEPGLTPIESTYRVFVGQRAAGPQAPGGKAQKPEFRQYKDVQAFSREEAVQKLQDELGPRKGMYEYQAQEMKGTAKPLAKPEAEGLAAGESRQPVGAHERHVARAQDALARTATPKPVTQPKPEPAPIQMPAGQPGHAEKAMKALSAKAARDQAVQEKPPVTAKPRAVITTPPPERGAIEEAAAPAEAVKSPKELKEVPAGFSKLGETFVVRAKPKGSGEWTGEQSVKALDEAGALRAARAKLGRNADKYDYEAELKPKEEAPKGGAAVRPRKEGVASSPLRQTPRPEGAPPSPKLETGQTVDYPGVGGGTVLKTYFAEVNGKQRLMMDMKTGAGKTARGLLAESAKPVQGAAEAVIEATKKKTTPTEKPTSEGVVAPTKKPAASTVESPQPVPATGAVVRAKPAEPAGRGAPLRTERPKLPDGETADEILKRVKARMTPNQAAFYKELEQRDDAEIRKVFTQQTGDEASSRYSTNDVLEIVRRDYLRGLEESQKAKPAPKAEAAAQAAPESNPATGRETVVKTASQSFPVRYEEVPLSSIKASHNPANFERTPGYPFEQQRPYHTNKLEQLKVMTNARNFDPEHIHADTPTATEGPPIVSREGYVLGGNGRVMTIHRALEQEKTITPEGLQEAVRRSGSKFGIAQAGNTSGTIIVRRLVEHMSEEDLAKATKALNTDLKLEVDPVSSAISRAKNLTPDTVEWLSRELNDAGPDATMATAIFNDPARLTDLARRLAQDQVIDASELPRILDVESGKLTPEGQRLIEAAVIGRVIKSPRMIRDMKPALKNLVFTALSPLTRAETFPAEWRVNNDIVNGLWLHHMAEKGSKTIDMMLEPQLIPDAFLEAVKDNKVAVAMARWFDENKGKPTALRAALSKYNAAAQDAVTGQESLDFGIPTKLPHEAFRDAFKLELTAEEYGTGDGMIYLHAGLHPKMFEPLWKHVGEKARQLRDLIFVPKDVREPYKAGESFEEWWLRGRLPRTGDAPRRWWKQTGELAAKQLLLNWESRRFPYFHEQMDQFKVEAMHVMGKVTDRFSEVVHPMVYRQDPTGIFKRRPSIEVEKFARDFDLVVGLSDMYARAKAGALTPASAFPGFAEFKPEEVTAALEVAWRTAMHSASPAVRDAHAAWIKLMGELRQELVKRGKLGKDDRLGWAYAPNVIDDFTWQQMWSVSTGPIRVKEAARGYVKKFVGHLRKHDPNMVNAGFHHMVNVYLDNLLDDFAHSVGQAWDHFPEVWKRVEELAKKEGRPVEELAEAIKIPPGFAVHRVGLERHLWNPSTLQDYIVQKVILEDPDIGIRIDNIRQLREYAGTAAGKARSAYLVPTAIADALKQFREPRNGLDRLASQFGRGVSVYKASILMSIYLPYRMRNQLGDLMNVYTRMPGKIPLLPGLDTIARYGPKAIVELMNDAFRGQTSKTLELAKSFGVTQNVRAVAELSDLRRHKDLATFFTPHRSAVVRPAAKAFDVANDALSGLMIFDSVAEGWLRYASWLKLVDQGLPMKRAERVVSEMIGDYRNVDPMTGMARRTALAPFAVWLRQMVPGWYRWITHAKLGKYFEGPEGGAVPPPNVPRPPLEAPRGTDPVAWKMSQSGRYTTGTVAAMTAAIGVPMLMTWYWNNVVNADANKKVDAYTKQHMTYYIIPGVGTEDGRKMMFAYPSPVDAVLSFFGAGDPVERGRKFYAAVQKGPQAAAKSFFDQIGETSTAIVAGVGEQLGAPARILADVVNLPYAEYQEAKKPDDKRDMGKPLKDAFRRIYKQDIPGTQRVIQAAHRQDLRGLPAWAKWTLSSYPWGALFYVPLSDDERKRRRAARSSSTGLKPGVSSLSSGLRPVAP